MPWIKIRKLLAYGVIGFIVNNIAGPLSQSQDKFGCTEVLGFSQSWQWFTGKAMSESRGNVSTARTATASTLETLILIVEPSLLRGSHGRRLTGMYLNSGSKIFRSRSPALILD